MSSQIEIIAYDPRWPWLFQWEADRIKSVLNQRAHRIEHIDSTSVPGLAAKPTIDLLLVVANTINEADYLPALEGAGYRLKIREPEWHEHRMLKGPDTDINLHIFSDGCPEIDKILTFRNWLRSNESDRELYARTKRELATKDWNQIQDYANAKTEVIEMIISRASQSADSL
jgi:GrpB-like predicted nucleotidyltransferase (UPF0157 family)